MKLNELKDSVNDQRISQVDDEVANDNFNETDLWELDVRVFKASSDYYKRCSRHRIKLHQGDWWVAVAVYLILASVAFVVV